VAGIRYFTFYGTLTTHSSWSYGSSTSLSSFDTLLRDLDEFAAGLIEDAALMVTVATMRVTASGAAYVVQAVPSEIGLTELASAAASASETSASLPTGPLVHAGVLASPVSASSAGSWCHAVLCRGGLAPPRACFVVARFRGGCGAGPASHSAYPASAGPFQVRVLALSHRGLPGYG
jgi:hypothetical protein